ncbi:MAG: NrfD/PsrC family molybdoenzyme membrane anchor subunit [Archaeoglobaceae archaeon]
MSLKAREAVAVTVLVALTVIGALGVLQMHTKPLMPVEPFESAEGMPWRSLVAVYVFLVVSTTGLCIIAAIGSLGYTKLEPILKELVLMAIVTIVVGLVAIAMDVEQVPRAHYAFLGHVNVSSAMFWMIMFYTVYFLFLIVEAWLLFYEDLAKLRESGGIRGAIARILTVPKVSGSIEFERVASFFAVSVGCISTSNLGALFALNYLPLWHDAMTPVYMLLTAIVSGASIGVIGVTLADWLRGRKIEGERYEALQTLRFILGFALVVAALFTGWRYIVKAYPNSALLSRESYEAFLAVFGFNFWFFEVFIGMLLPLIMLATPQIGRKTAGVFFASLLALIGMFVSRFDFVLGGQLVKLITGLSLEAAYHPFEVIATTGFLALSVLLYYVLYKLLPVEVEA